MSWPPWLPDDKPAAFLYLAQQVFELCKIEIGRAFGRAATDPPHQRAVFLPSSASSVCDLPTWISFTRRATFGDGGDGGISQTFCCRNCLQR